MASSDGTGWAGSNFTPYLLITSRIVLVMRLLRNSFSSMNRPVEARSMISH